MDKFPNLLAKISRNSGSEFNASNHNLTLNTMLQTNLSKKVEFKTGVPFSHFLDKGKKAPEPNHIHQKPKTTILRPPKNK